MPLAKVVDGEDRNLLPEEYFDFKSRIHDRLLDLVDLSVLDRIDPDNADRVQGRIDLSVRYRGRVWLIELKVNGMTRPGRALEQLRAKGHAAKYATGEVTLIGIELSRETRNVSRFEWERLNPSK